MGFDMAEQDDIKKFREMLDSCMEDSVKKLDTKKVSDQKKQTMIGKFKKAMWG
jgi:hypothetical protein